MNKKNMQLENNCKVKNNLGEVCKTLQDGESLEVEEILKDGERGGSLEVGARVSNNLGEVCKTLQDSENLEVEEILKEGERGGSLEVG
ncbi:MAG: hypothetical protein RR140_04100, partial [Clostridia bacterium]